MNKMIEQLKTQFKNKKVLIVGLGLQAGGVGLVKFFCRLGAIVTVTDLKTKKELKESVDKIRKYKVRNRHACSLTLGGHKLKDFLEADIIFKGPSVPWDLSYLKEAQKKGIPIEMEMSFFALNCPASIIGVTGTRGKSTTAMMIYKVLKNTGFSAYVGGNISGFSTISLLEKLTKNDWLILELSSWQLSGFQQKKLSPHIAVITNFYPDHLNYYQNLADYWFDKQTIYLYQKSSDFLIINEELKNRLKPYPKSKVIFSNKNNFKEELIYLKGEHNLENASAVLCLSNLLKINRDKAINLIRNFKNLSYRCEKIAQIEKIEIYNDSTSTTPTACEKAIETFKGKDIILILGGNSKKLPFDNLVKVINQYVNKVIFLKGSFTDEICPFLDKNKIVNNIPYDSLEKAFKDAMHNNVRTEQCSVPTNSIILFSPAATSFSLFKNEFHRGEEFNKIVKSYAKKTS